MSDELQQELEALRIKVGGLRKYLDVDQKEKRVVELDRRMSAPDFWDDPKAQDVTRERSQAADIVETWTGLDKDVKDAVELQELAAMEGDQAVLADLAAKVEEIKERIHKAEIAKMLSGEMDDRVANVTVSAGQGGTEACDWAEMLYRLYHRWAEARGYRLEVQDYQPGEEAGIRSVSFRLSGDHAYGWVKSERGVHRLVRISPFDANKRRQTSFAAVDVIPEIEDDIQIEIKDEDLRVDTYRSSGAGGQHVNKTESAIRLTHLPTGVVVACQMERSQHKNRATAMKMLRARLYDLEIRKRQEQVDAANSDKMQIGWGSQIRSYVLQPYQMIKDLRTGEEVQGNAVQAVLEGEPKYVDRFMEAFLLGKKIDKSKAAANDDD